MLQSKVKNRGVSTVVGAVFIGIIVFSVVAGYFAFQATVNASFQQAINERNQLDVHAKIESLVLPSAYVDSSGILWVNASNVGPSTIDIVDVVVLNSACNGAAPGSPGPVALTFGLNPNSKSQISTKYNYKSQAGGATVCAEVITSLGNFADIDYPIPSSGRIVVITQLSSNPIFAGSSVFDTATLIGVTSNAGGTVTYNYYSGSNCTGRATMVGTVTVTNAQVPYSSSVTYSTAGSYSWNANYSGDVFNRGPALSGCEPLTVSSSNGGPVLGALSAGAIGDLYLNFHSYTWYNVTQNGCKTGGSYSGYCLQLQTPPQFNNAWVIPSADAGQIAFSIQVRDLNPNQLTITLDQFTMIFQFWPGGSSFRSAGWFIVSVDSSSNILKTYSPITLNYNQTATLVFADGSCLASGCAPKSPFTPEVLSGSNSPGTNQIASVFIFAHGWEGIPTTQTANYGQNIPFVTTVYS